MEALLAQSQPQRNGPTLVGPPCASVTHMILCVEATAAIARSWAQDWEVFLDPLLSAIEGGQLGAYRLACVLFATNPLHR